MPRLLLLFAYFLFLAFIGFSLFAITKRISSSGLYTCLILSIAGISGKESVRWFHVKRDRLLLFAVTCDCKKLKAVNCEGHASRDA